jgi:hypothetical protein
MDANQVRGNKIIYAVLVAVIAAGIAGLLLLQDSQTSPSPISPTSKAADGIDRVKYPATTKGADVLLTIKLNLAVPEGRQSEKMTLACKAAEPLSGTTGFTLGRPSQAKAACLAISQIPAGNHACELSERLMANSTMKNSVATISGSRKGQNFQGRYSDGFCAEAKAWWPQLRKLWELPELSDKDIAQAKNQNQVAKQQIKDAKQVTSTQRSQLLKSLRRSRRHQNQNSKYLAPGAKIIGDSASPAAAK